MKVLFNPKNGADVRTSFRGSDENSGHFFEIKVGETLRFDDNVADFLVSTYGFLRDVTDEYEKTSADAVEKVSEAVPLKETVDLIDKRLHPEKYIDAETRGKDFYGPGLEDDSGK